jgi:hypothetical protein
MHPSLVYNLVFQEQTLLVPLFSCVCQKIKKISAQTNKIAFKVIPCIGKVQKYQRTKNLNHPICFAHQKKHF